MDLSALFENLTVDAIRRYIALKQEEHLHLDFKTVSGSDLGNADDRKSLAKALSAYANSDGGLIIWGVLARRIDADAPDCAVGEQVIQALPMFVSKLNQYTGEMVSPLVDGVRHRALAVDGSRGFALTLVPASDAGPHMAKGREDRYYKRSGDSFYRMEHFDIEDMFGRRKRPLLQVETKLVRAGGMRSSERRRNKGRFVIGLRNGGRGAARAPFLEIEVQPPYSRAEHGVNGSGYEGLPRLHHTGPSNVFRFGGGADVLIHPGTVLEVVAVEVSAEWDRGRPQPVEDLKVAYCMTADGVPMVEGSTTTRGEDIQRALE